MIRAARIGRATAAERDEQIQVLDALRYRGLHRRAQRDRIPAYLVLGPPGMGRSAIVQRSGIKVDRPLDLSSSTWWIGEDALFVEVSPQGADQESGYPALSLLGALRPAVPVSGVILVISPADLTLADAGERADMSAALVDFLRAFEARFHYTPPLYLVVSKLDLTPGFAEFFDRLEPDEREQPWGFTLPVDLGRRVARGPMVVAAGDRTAKPTAHPVEPREGQAAGVGKPTQVAKASPEDVAAAYHAGFNRMLDAISTRVTQWISAESDPVQCARIAGFGAQVAALEAILEPIVEQLLPADDRRWPGAWLRGVYLMSTQQDALSIDVLLPDMAKRFGLPRTGTLPPDLCRDDEALGYFVAGVFRRVILPEAGLAQQGHPRLRGAAIRNWSLSAAAVAACLALGLVAVLDYREGVARIARAGEAADAVGPVLSASDPARMPAMLPALDVLASLSGPDADVDPRLIVGFDSFSQGLISQAAAGLYDRALVMSLAPHLVHNLDRDLVSFDASPQGICPALAAAAADRLDVDGAYRRWLNSTAAALSPEVRASLDRHGLGTLRTGAVPGAGAAYTEAARGFLQARGEAPR